MSNGPPTTESLDVDTILANIQDITGRNETAAENISEFLQLSAQPAGEQDQPEPSSVIDRLASARNGCERIADTLRRIDLKLRTAGVKAGI